MPPRLRHLLAVLLLASCSSEGVDAGTLPSSPPSTIAADDTTTTLDDRPCAATTVLTPAGATGNPTIERLPGGNPTGAAVAVSQAMFGCAADVVVVDSAGLNRIALAAVLAVRVQAPLLFGDPEASSLLQYELDRLSPQRLWLIGDTATAVAPEWTEVERIGGTDEDIARRVTELIGADEDLLLPSQSGTATVAVAVEAMITGKTLSPPPADGSGPVSPVTGDDIVAGTGESGLLWLVDTAEPSSALVAAAGAITSGGFMGLVDGADLRSEVVLSRDLEPIADRVRLVQVVGATEDAGWQAQVLLNGRQLPGGGYLMFPGRRLVALYGNPLTTSLGPLGEQDPAAGLARIERISDGYDADGESVIPTWELIATVASGSPGNDGDYSNEMSLDLLRSWVDFAAGNGMYVLLDLQPGRTTFLSQAVLYEELLLEPHVGLALDPEWRLGPDEVHLEQIGSVSAAEVNEVVDWLAQLTRDHGLPQKVLLIHQFRNEMLPDRQDIEAPPELTVVIQMDGHGTIPEKMTSWVRTTAGWETDQFEYGWKNFYDEDIPGPMSAADVLQLVPVPVYISFQ